MAHGVGGGCGTKKSQFHINDFHVNNPKHKENLITSIKFRCDFVCKELVKKLGMESLDWLLLPIIKHCFGSIIQRRVVNEVQAKLASVRMEKIRDLSRLKDGSEEFKTGLENFRTNNIEEIDVKKMDLETMKKVILISRIGGFKGTASEQ